MVTMVKKPSVKFKLINLARNDFFTIHYKYGKR